MFASIFQKGSSNSQLRVTREDRASEQRLSPLYELAYCFSPLVEETSEDTITLDIRGGGLIFGPPADIAAAIITRARELEIDVSVAIAANPDAAIHIARNIDGVCVAVAGQQGDQLSSLPLEVMDFSLVRVEEKVFLETLETLRLWGLHTFGQFAALPERGVVERLGQDGFKLQRLARGTSRRHLKINEIEPCFEYAMELDHPIKELEPLSFVLSRLLNQLCASLHGAAFSTNELQLVFRLEGIEEDYSRTLSLPVPMRDHKTFLKLLLMDIETAPPESPVKWLSVKCTPVKPRELQTGLFEPLSPEPEKLEITLARIAKLVGHENVGSPELLNTHRPDAFTIRRFGHRNKRRIRRIENKVRRVAGLVGFRMFRPPLPARVEAPHGRPISIKAAANDKSISGKVVRLAGPWRITGDWWTGSRWARDEWDIAVKSSSNGEAVYRIFRELQSGEWFVEGMYD